MSKEYWLEEEGAALESQDDDYLLLNSGPTTSHIVIGDDYTVSELPSGECSEAEIAQIEKDHSWIGWGLVSLDEKASINASVNLQAEVEIRPVASLTLGSRPNQAVWRVRGWRLQLETSDITRQCLGLAMQGGTVCVNAQLKNLSTSQVTAMTLTARVAFAPAKEVSLMTSSRGFESLLLVGEVIDTPKLEQETIE